MSDERTKQLKAERLDLVPPGALLDVARVFANGAAKYSDFGYLRDDSEYRRYLAALLRHVMAWSAGEDLDPESEINHLAHAAANCLMLMQLQADAIGIDDRLSVDDRSTDEPDEVVDPLAGRRYPAIREVGS